MNENCELPIVQAPMAGGPNTPALTAAVSAVGGFGYLAAGYLTVDALRAALSATRELTGAPFGVNIFVPSEPADQTAVRAYATRLAPEAERLGVVLGEPRWDDDWYGDKLAVLLADPVHTVSFTFGCPGPQDVERLHGVGSRVAVTVTSAVEAVWAFDAGADELIVQGTEAGGHQATFRADEDTSPNTMPLLELLGEVRDTVALSLIAAGGLMTGRDVAVVLAAGARAAQLGTALLCTPEAGTSPVHRTALMRQRYDETMITRAFSGRWARGLANRFARQHSAYAPAAYPEVHYLTRPLRSAATAAGDPDVPNLWAGTGWRQLTAEPAGHIVRRIAAECVSTRGDSGRSA